MTVLTIENLSVSYQDLEVIKQFELTVESGEIIALFGPSGCGKTTVLKSVAGLLEQARGEIEIAGRKVLTAEKSVPTELRKVGLIFQDYALFPHLTVAQNIAFGLDKKAKQQQAEIVARMLELIKLSEYADAYPSQLSGGQQQRIAIVRALACEPDILLFDEAFSNIDPQFRFELIADIRDLLKQQNIAALFVTHNQDEAFAFCDRIALVNAGKVEQLATSEQLFAQPQTEFVAEFLGQGIWLEGQVSAADTIQTQLGAVAYQGSETLDAIVGQTVKFYLRPHQMSLSKQAQSEYRVVSERFVGHSYQCQVAVEQKHWSVSSPVSLLNQAVSLNITSPITKVFY